MPEVIVQAFVFMNESLNYFPWRNITKNGKVPEHRRTDVENRHYGNEGTPADSVPKE